jgi:hypothetical protein
LAFETDNKEEDIIKAVKARPLTNLENIADLFSTFNILSITLHRVYHIPLTFIVENFQTAVEWQTLEILTKL